MVGQIMLLCLQTTYQNKNVNDRKEQPAHKDSTTRISHLKCIFFLSVTDSSNAFYVKNVNTSHL